MPSVAVTPLTGLGEDAYFVAIANNIGLVVKNGKESFRVTIYADLPDGYEGSNGEDAGSASRGTALIPGDWI